MIHRGSFLWIRPCRREPKHWQWRALAHLSEIDLARELCLGDVAQPFSRLFVDLHLREAEGALEDARLLGLAVRLLVVLPVFLDNDLLVLLEPRPGQLGGEGGVGKLLVVGRWLVGGLDQAPVAVELQNVEP